MQAQDGMGEDRDTELGGGRPGETLSWKTVTQPSVSGNFGKDFMAKHSHVQDYLAENYTTVSKLNRIERR